MLGQFSIHESSLQETRQPSKRGSKRARLVCCRCHKRKIKCDLQPGGSDQTRRCSNCYDAGVPCELRPSKRSHRGQADVLSTDSPERPLYVGDEIDPDTAARFPGQAEDEISAQPFAPEEVAPGPSTVSARPIGNLSLPSPQSSYLGDFGYMRIFSRERGGQPTTPFTLPTGKVRAIDNIAPVLHETHLDVFFEFATTWCPVLDRMTYESVPQFRNSVLLKHALALCSNRIRPALIEQAPSADHYERAKELFYRNQEPNPFVRVIAVMLFYWYGTEGPNSVSIDNTWWWTGLAIRLAQQMRLHRQSDIARPLCEGDSPGLRRRIWWTLVARERISSISQGRPCVIDMEDCNTPMPTKEDFPCPDDIRTSAFLSWLKLCDIIGRIGTNIRREASFSVVPFARELVSWVQSLPPALQPSICQQRTMSLHQDVHGMHLTYLSIITLMHLNKASQPLPQASTAAVVAASCTSRIFYDYLLRGSLRFLAGQAGWYITTAVLALVHARKVQGLRQAVDRDIKVLRAAIKEMSQLWPSARVFENGINQLINANPTDSTDQTRQFGDLSSSLDENGNLGAEGDLDWRAYFPYISTETSPLIGALLGNSSAIPAPEAGSISDFSGQLNDFLLSADMFNLDFLEPWG